MDIDVRQGDLSSDQVQSLITEHLSGMHNNSPPGQVNALAIKNLQAPSVTFWTACVAGILSGCGALKELDPLTGEVKSMRARPAFEPAHRLYRRNGFEWSGVFGEYNATDFNVFVAKVIA